MPGIDTTNQNQAYWEKILADSNLALKEEPETLEITTEEFKELANLELLPEEDYTHEDPVINFNGITKSSDVLNADHSGLTQTNEELRTKVGSDDVFFTGHRIIKQRRGNRPVPTWATDTVQLRVLLLRAFPKLEENEKQRKAAGRWARIIQLYFRSQLTEGQVAQELRMTIDAVKTVNRSIARTAKGLRANGSGARTRTK